MRCVEQKGPCSVPAVPAPLNHIPATFRNSVSSCSPGLAAALPKGRRAGAACPEGRGPCRTPR